MYAYDGELTRDIVRNFCQERKQAAAEGQVTIFLQVVVFDSADNARKSEFPVPAAYSIPDATTKHMRLNYVYNCLNGSSEAEWCPRGSVHDKAVSEKDI